MDPLTRLQLDVESLLESEAYFSVIPILSQAKGVLDADIDERLGKRGFIENSEEKFGCAVVVGMPIVEVPSPEISGPRLDVIIPVAVYERPLVNRDPVSGIGEVAEEIGLQILAAVHGRIVADGVSQIYADSRAMDPLPIDDEKTIAYMIYFNCRLGLARRVKVSTPIISGNGDAVSIFCNTNGAAIYYTTDGSYPAPTSVNAEATLFGFVLQTESGIVITTEEGDELTTAVPFSVISGTAIRAAAYKPDTHLGSDVAMQTF